ncbi:MAG: hypothetical protein HQK94_18170 [Nitrospirae bacterium]|nr:hypothetical protein [Nitrospirota bacterium]
MFILVEYEMDGGQVSSWRYSGTGAFGAVLKGILLSLIFLLAACAVNGLNNREAADENNFPDRDMSSLLIPLSNGGFEDTQENICSNTDNCKEHFSFPGWDVNSTGVVIDKGPGYNSDNSLKVTATMEDNSKVNPRLNSITLFGSTGEAYPLDLQFLTKKITVEYQPDIFAGDLAKSCIRFQLIGKNGRKSVVTYVLNGDNDHNANVNTFANGITYITYIKNDNKIGSSNVFEIDNLLRIQNEGALKINGGIALTKEEIRKVSLIFNTSYHLNGNIKVTHRGWAKYIDERGLPIGQSIMSGAVYRKINIPEQWQSEKMNISVSAWVWSDTPAAALLKISSNTGKESVSAFHSGGRTWEYLTVVYPYHEITESFTISLVTVNGIAMFDNVQPVVIADDRFDYNPDNPHWFKEKVMYTKSNRIRIVIVGNSTINGAGANNNGTISYCLQSKLESLYPGRFEVINYGISAGNLQSQIIAVNRGVIGWRASDMEILKPEAIKAVSKRDGPTISELRPDIVVIGSMWSDIREMIGFSDFDYVGAMETADCNGIPCSILYLKRLYAYMDDPNESNFQEASAKFKLYLEMSQKNRRVDELNRLTYNELQNNEYMRYLIGNAGKKYSYLLSEFTERVIKIAKVWQITLPFKGGANYSKYINKSSYFMQDGIVFSGDIYIFYYKYQLSDDIQRMSAIEVSDRFNLPFIDLSHIVYSELSSLPISTYVNLGYFIDPLHFSYRGYELLADRLFNNMQNEFRQLPLPQGK